MRSCRRGRQIPCSCTRARSGLKCGVLILPMVPLSRLFATEYRFVVVVSGVESVAVAGEQGRLADVGRSEQAGCPAFEADGETAVWGHAVGEGGQIALVRLRVFAACGQCGQVISVSM